MKKNEKIIIGLILLFIAGCSIIREKKTVIEYPGEGLPNRKPEIFAMGIISSKDKEHSSLSFSPDGKEIWWSLWPLPRGEEKRPQIIKFIKYKNNCWSDPAEVPFSGKYRDGSPAFSHDGNRIFFYSDRPLDEESEERNDIDIWFVKRTKDGWSKPINPGKPLNSGYLEASPCLTANGNLYFTTNRNQYPDPVGNNDIFVSHYRNGMFCEPVSISDNINTSYARESFPFVSPDETYIIFSRDNRKFDSEGNCISGCRKLMISFSDEAGIWTAPVDMGANFANARFPSVSPDGKYLFFTNYSEKTSDDFYWVDAGIIHELKPDFVK